MVRQKIIPLSIIAILVVALIFYLMPVILQEGNPLPVIAAVIKVETGSSEIVPISSTKYLQKAGPSEPLVRLMESKGLRFIEQLGAGYFFTYNGETFLVSSRMLTTRYMVFELERPL